MLSQLNPTNPNPRFLKRANSIDRAKYYKHYFIVNRLMLLVGGVWPPNTKNIFIIITYKIWTFSILIFVIIYFPVAQFITLTDTYHDLEPFIKNMSMALTHFIGVFKALIWYVRHQKIESFMTTLESEDLHYEPCENFQPSIISKKARRKGYVFSMTFLILCHWTLLSSYLPDIFHALFNPIYLETGNGTLEFHQTLPYYSWYPFKYDNNRLLYIIAIFGQMGSIFLYAYIIIGIDTLFMCMMNHVSAHLLILQGALRTLRERSLLRVKDKFEPGSINDSKRLDIEMQFQMKKCVHHLQTLMKLCQEMENVFSFLTLGQVLTTLFILCTCLFLVSTTPIASSKFLAEVAYMISMGFQLFLYCWFGNEVYLASSGIPQAIYESNWKSSSKEIKVLMLITMARMKRPISLTVGKFAPLTLETFVTIVRGSYSFLQF